MKKWHFIADTVFFAKSSLLNSVFCDLYQKISILIVFSAKFTLNILVLMTMVAQSGNFMRTFRLEELKLRMI